LILPIGRRWLFRGVGGLEFFLVAGAGLALGDFCFFMIALKRQQGCRTPKVRKFKNVLKIKGVVGWVS
jgi:hypothetical protein